MATHLANEAALLTQARSGNRDAFGTLSRHYYQNIYRLTVGITGNHEDAEDALQEALLQAYLNLPRFRGGSRFYTWLVRIAVNQALMKLRKRRTVKEVPSVEVIGENGEGSVIHEIEDSRQDPEERYASIELEDNLRSAAESLGSRLGPTFLAWTNEELPLRELADKLEISETALKSRLRRARFALRQRVRKFLQPHRNMSLCRHASA